ncbi:uncharacterized protein LOC113792393 [Dermatophagoides pteronyssinus]|uniref:uncharacterized protein LOC113792393 n=1 Tax=Dermatophagoides pteronyssinus TaxID=6956 RepID=UPI003F67CFC0
MHVSFCHFTTTFDSFFFEKLSFFLKILSIKMKKMNDCSSENSSLEPARKSRRLQAKLEINRLNYVESSSSDDENDDDNYNEMKFSFIGSHNNDNNGDDDDDDDNLRSLKRNNSFALSDHSFGDQLFQSQTSFSQLTQNSLQSGQFTYLIFSPSSSLITNNILDDNCLDRILELFQLLIKNINDNKNLIQTIGSSLEYFRQPHPKLIDFLNYFLNLYSKLSSNDYLESRNEIGYQYCLVVEQIFDQLDRSRSNWTEMNLFNLFRTDSKMNNKSTIISQNNHSYLFDLIEFIDNCFGHFQQQQTTNKDDDEENVKKNNRNNHRSNALIVSVRLFEIIVKFLTNDMERFFQKSFNFLLDIQDDNDRPLIVRLLWPNVKHPDYMSSMVRYFLYLLTKSIRTFSEIQQQTYRSSSIDLLPKQSNIFIQSIIKMLMLIAESLRIGSGNIRPYLSLTSSRNLIANDLWCQFERYKLNENFNLLKFLSKQFQSLSWFNLQFMLQIMDHLFSDLKHTLPMILGQNNGLRLRKLRITLRLLVSTFLTGNLDDLRVEHFRMMMHNNKKPVELNSIEEKLKQFKELIKSSLSNQDDSGRQPSYQTYVTRKTNYGGNTLHMASRNNDPAVIRKYFDQTQPNQQDRSGYTPLIDCIRYENFDCLQTLIQSSIESDYPLNYEIQISKDNGFTALHYALIIGNRKSIRLLLENGGYHLMFIESKDGYSPQTLIEYLDQQHSNELNEENLSEFISKIECKKIPNHLPAFDELSRKFQMDLEQLLSFYCEMITNLFDCYLQTNRLHQFNFDSIFLDDQQQQIDKTTTNDNLDHQSICLRLSHEFQRIFQRNPNELELTMLMDDLKIISKFPEYFEQFSDQLKREQNLQNFRNDFELEFQSLRLSIDLIQKNMGKFFIEKLLSSFS